MRRAIALKHWPALYADLYRELHGELCLDQAVLEDAIKRLEYVGQYVRPLPTRKLWRISYLTGKTIIGTLKHRSAKRPTLWAKTRGKKFIGWDRIEIVIEGE